MSLLSRMYEPFRAPQLLEEMRAPTSYDGWKKPRVRSLGVRIFVLVRPSLKSHTASLAEGAIPEYSRIGRGVLESMTLPAMEQACGGEEEGYS